MTALSQIELSHRGALTVQILNFLQFFICKLIFDRIQKFITHIKAYSHAHLLSDKCIKIFLGLL
jgi:hypothetical protein